MYNREFKILTIILILLFTYCCFKTTEYLAPKDSYKISKIKKIIVTMKDGTEWKLRNAHVEKEKIIGYTKNNIKKEIDFSLIKSVRTKKVNFTYPILFSGVAIIAILLIHGASTAPEPPPAPEWD